MNIIFPVIRSILRAMDGMELFLSSKYNNTAIESFCIMSEVPFAAWMAGVDQRVGCSIPVLADMVNATANLQRNYR